MFVNIYGSDTKYVELSTNDRQGLLTWSLLLPFRSCQFTLTCMPSPFILCQIHLAIFDLLYPLLPLPCAASHASFMSLFLLCYKPSDLGSCFPFVVRCPCMNSVFVPAKTEMSKLAIRAAKLVPIGMLTVCRKIRN
jgi:hypothetical protein